ncbi:MAG: NADAR domain-containing protein [Gammaproteobacteria bacterium]|nr:NADAR domain-containing protein [Gammaproteobacteria bacterium]
MKQIRTYKRSESAVFSKTKEAFGGLSNMAAGFPLRVNGVRILTSEALYQACRFPHRPEVQRLIIGEASPMTAKMKSKPYRQDSRPDWDRVRVKIMRWCLRVKLAQNWRSFSELLLKTGDKQIVEQSSKDDFWGAKPIDECTLVGMNVLGRLLMELREEIKTSSRESLKYVQPLTIPDFMLEGRPIEAVGIKKSHLDEVTEELPARASHGHIDGPAVMQPSLFDEPVVKESPSAASLESNECGIRIADLKPYSAYKESGLPWLGRVPTHWGLIPNRGLIRKRKILVGNRHSDYRLLSLTKQGVIVRDITTGKGKFSSDMGTSQEVRHGDLVFCLFDVPETPRTVGLSRHDGMITGAYTVFESLGRGSSEYFELFYRAMDDRKLLSPLYSGLRNTIPADRFLGTKTPQPPPDEQAAIVRFLDWANGRLERAILAKQKVIALLNEQKQAIIHRAVTRGLKPSAPLKPSGIPWLGDIPQHWELAPNRAFLRIRKVLVGEKHNQFQLLSLTKRGVIVRDLAEMRGKFSSDMGTSQEVRVGDLVFCLFDVPETPRTVGHSRFNGMITGAYTVMECSDHDTARFLESFYIAMDDRKLLSPLYSGLRNTIPKERFLGIKTPMPPPEERFQILGYIECETGALDSAIHRLSREIQLMIEYRTRLVADVVTGKLDVREAATQLPEVTAADTTEDDAYLSFDAETVDEEELSL